MKKITQKWLEYAKGDLEGAEILFKSAKTQWTYQLSVLHCHQAVEKILKAVIVAKGKEIKKIHDLIPLLRDSELDLPREFQEYIDKLNPHYQPIRYPDIPYKGPILKYNREIAQEYLKKTKEIFSWIEKKLMSKN
ncbi:MAG: HEPN domain-containing protein [Patescibacteria group bacterium]|nr:HEPN domain-containing protein [Patescibacteria group bacterium]